VSPSDYDATRGFTLVEVLIAMLVLLLGTLSSLVGVMAAGDYNLRNALRNEAVRIAQEQLEDMRVGRYDSIVSAKLDIQRQVRKSPYSFHVERPVITDGTLKWVGLNVRWYFKDKTHWLKWGELGSLCYDEPVKLHCAMETVVRQRTF
jgi:type IV pilus assembly protein PilV